MIRKVFYFSALVICITYGANAQGIGIFEGHSGIEGAKGSAVYNSKTQQYTLTSYGGESKGTDKPSYFLWRKIKGDFIITANVTFVPTKAAIKYGKIGVTLRSGLDNDAKFIDVAKQSGKATAMQYKLIAGSKQIN